MDDHGSSRMPAPWCMVRQTIAQMWCVPPFVVDDPALADEVQRQLEMLEVEAKYRPKAG